MQKTLKNILTSDKIKSEKEREVNTMENTMDKHNLQKIERVRKD
uniref:Uncharacterized protein n=1 Tax=Microviridae sp. ctJkV4 TaxID=2827641 RepID=A0A8S5SJ68_9VIRU|nr:MAG TPA: hypothetical protein [Microviridae sp. ctJkV4]